MYCNSYYPDLPHTGILDTQAAPCCLPKQSRPWSTGPVRGPLQLCRAEQPGEKNLFEKSQTLCSLIMLTFSPDLAIVSLAFLVKY